MSKNTNYWSNLYENGKRDRDAGEMRGWSEEVWFQTDEKMGCQQIPTNLQTDNTKLRNINRDTHTRRSTISTVYAWWNWRTNSTDCDYGTQAFAAMRWTLRSSTIYKDHKVSNSRDATLDRCTMYRDSVVVFQCVKHGLRIKKISSKLWKTMISTSTPSGRDQGAT